MAVPPRVAVLENAPVDLGVVGQAAGMFAVTNVDDLVILALFFARSRSVWQVVAGQYLGFAGILAVAVVGALGASLLPEQFRPWLGLIPLALGLKAAWSLWRGSDDEDEPDAVPRVAGGVDRHWAVGVVLGMSTRLVV